MRILITGFVVFVIWCVISAWLYNDILLPAMNPPVPVQTIPNSMTREADSLAKLKAMMPMDLMIYFEFNDSKFKSDPRYDSRVAEFKAWLDKYPGSMLSVTGHSDLVGTAEFNQDLGLRRAVIVGKYLETRGILPPRMMIESKGEDQPVGDYLTADGRAKNRRTQISIKMQ
jgi:outer membrane protein OmpA-like peptidoglycan-associated protein